MIRIITSLATLLLISCSTHNSLTPVKSPVGYSPAKANIILKHNEIFQVDFKTSLPELITLQKNKFNNTLQVYYHNLSTGTERKITHTRSNQNSIKYNSKYNLIFYSSPMDESYEQVFSNHKNTVNYSPVSYLGKIDKTEIYSISLVGSKIKRRTTNVGYDGDIEFNPDGDTMYFVREKNKQLQIYSLKLKSNRAQGFFKSKNHQRFPNISNTGKYITWVEFNNQPTSNLVIKELKRKTQIQHSLPEGIYLHPSFIDDQHLLFSAQIAPNKNFQIYSYDLKQSCLKRLSFNHNQDFHPKFNPKNQQIVFISEGNGQHSLFKMKFQDYSSCPNVVTRFSISK